MAPGLLGAEELGDPCCLWAPGEDKLLASSNVQDLSHPGFASSSLPARRVEEQRAACALRSSAGASAVTPTETCVLSPGGELRADRLARYGTWHRLTLPPSRP